jgi:hypothetical protein
VYCLQLAGNCPKTGKWTDLVGTTNNLQVPQRVGNVLTCRGSPRLILLHGILWAALSPFVKAKVTLRLAMSQSWCQAPSGMHDQIFVPVWRVLSRTCWAPSLTRGLVCLLSVTVSTIKSTVEMSPYSHFTHHTCFMCIQYIQGLLYVLRAFVGNWPARTFFTCLTSARKQPVLLRSSLKDYLLFVLQNLTFRHCAVCYSSSESESANNLKIKMIIHLPKSRC